MEKGYDADLSGNEEIGDNRPKKHQLKQKNHFGTPRNRIHNNNDNEFLHYSDIKSPEEYSSGSDTPNPSPQPCSGFNSPNNSGNGDETGQAGKKRKRDESEGDFARNKRFNCVDNGNNNDQQNLQKRSFSFFPDSDHDAA